MNHSEQLNELAGALAEAQSKFAAIPKDANNPFFKNSYASLPRVVEVASPVLTECGLSVSQFPGTNEHGDTLTTWLLHKSGQYIKDTMQLHLTKPDAQGQGSAMTYARRYSYMAVLGLVADDDDDANKASTAAAKVPKVQSKPWSSKTAQMPPEEAARDINADVKPISSATKLLLAQSVEKQHGISDMDVITAKLTSLATTNFDAPVGSITEDQGLQLLNIINKTAKGAL